jgi:hypothetical protein
MQEILAQWCSGAGIEFKNTNAEITYKEKTKLCKKVLKASCPSSNIRPSTGRH